MHVMCCCHLVSLDCMTSCSCFLNYSVTFIAMVVTPATMRNTNDDMDCGDGSQVISVTQRQTSFCKQVHSYAYLCIHMKYKERTPEIFVHVSICTLGSEQKNNSIVFARVFTQLICIGVNGEEWRVSVNLLLKSAEACSFYFHLCIMAVRSFICELAITSLQQDHQMMRAIFSSSMYFSQNLQGFSETKVDD